MWRIAFEHQNKRSGTDSERSINNLATCAIFYGQQHYKQYQHNQQ